MKICEPRPLVLPNNSITNLILVGPMGAGKSTVGRQLAERLKMPFVDSDHEIERRTGVDIPTIFEYEGEAGFRERETLVIKELCQRTGIVLATGGGCVMRPENRECIKACGFVVYLKTSVRIQLRRTSRDRNRPLLQTSNPRARLEALLKVRDPLYREVADIILNTDRNHMRAIIRAIIGHLEQKCAV